MTPTKEQIAQWAMEAYEAAKDRGKSLEECTTIFNEALVIRAMAEQAELDAKACEGYGWPQAAAGIRANAPKEAM